MHPDISEPGRQLPSLYSGPVPALFVDKDGRTWRRVVEFFTANIRNPNTRAAYAQAVRQFCDFCDRRRVDLPGVSPFVVAAHIEELQQRLAVPSVKQHLAALRMLFDFLVIGQVLPSNPASSVRGPRHVVTKGLTPVLSADEARVLLDSIDTSKIVGLRDRALIGVMVYSFARIGAVVGMNTKDYFLQGKRAWFRLHEKGGRLHDVPVHHKEEEYMDQYLALAELAGQKDAPLFQSLDRQGRLTGRRLHRLEALAMVKRRARETDLSDAICCHSFRATGITVYLQNGGQLEHAQRLAAHSSPRTTKLYDRTSDALSLDEIERIVL
jgi:integrase/recombinase XerD